MAIRKTMLATQIALALAVSSANSYAGDVEISLPAATDAFTIDQPAGTELMRVHGNGNVGIGTTNPNYALHVNGIVEVDNAHGSIFLKRTEPYTAVGHGNGVITGMSPNSKHLGNFGYLNTTTDPDNPQGRFFIQTDTNTNQINENTEHHFNITHAGNIGIGTTDPSDGTANGGQALKLDVEGAVGASTYCDENGENCQTILQLAGGGGGGKFVDGTDPNNAVYTTGNVGIGETSPANKLQVNITQDDDGIALKDTLNGDSYLKLSSNAAGGYLGFSSDGTTLTGFMQQQSPAHSEAGNIVINNQLGKDINLLGGNVGIGTATPSAKLEVFDGEIRSTRNINSPQYVRISGGNASKTGTYIGAHASESNKKVLEFLSVHDESGSAAGFNGFLFKVGGESAPQSVMAIRENQVGIGTTIPEAPLHISGTGSDAVLIDADYPLLRLRSNQGVAGSKNFQMQNVQGSLHFGATEDDWNWKVAGQQLVLQNDGNAYFNEGSVGIGTATPSQRLEVDGNIKLTTHIMSDSEIKLNPNGGTSDGFKLTGNASTSTLVAHRNELILGTERDTNASHDDVIFRYTDSDRTFDWMRLDGTTEYVGIGLSSPEVHLDVAGSIKIADSGKPCNATTEGQIRYDATNKKHQGCDGTSWNNLY